MYQLAAYNQLIATQKIECIYKLQSGKFLDLMAQVYAWGKQGEAHLSSVESITMEKWSNITKSDKGSILYSSHTVQEWYDAKIA